MGCVSSKHFRRDRGRYNSDAHVHGTAPGSQHGMLKQASLPHDAISAAKLQSVVSKGTARTGSQQRDDDEDSDWDHCSTAFDMENGTSIDSKHQSADMEAEDDVRGSLIDKARAPQTAENGLPFRETTKLWVDMVCGCMFVNQYIVVKYLGRGACGKVFMCLNTLDSKLYAMKAVRKVDLVQQTQAGRPKRRNPIEDLRREIAIMRNMQHDNIVTLKEVIDDPLGRKILLVMEYMEGGPVMTRQALERRQSLPESIAWLYFRDMVKALDYLHLNKIVHGDLKPENVLMSGDGLVKLSDFGCSKVFVSGNEYLDRCNGTPAFLAPEMMKPNTRYRGRPTDVYALGACLYTFIFGRIPFTAPNLYKLFQLVQAQPVAYPEDVPISSELRDLLDKLLTKDPKERIVLGDVMKHAWVTKNGAFPMRSLKRAKKRDAVDDSERFVPREPNRPKHLDQLLRLSNIRHTFRPGELLMQQGEPGDTMMYLEQGTVEVLLRVSGSRQGAQQGNTKSSSASSRLRTGEERHESHIMGDNDADAAAVHAQHTDEEEQLIHTRLVQAAAKAREFVKTLQVGQKEYLVARRGPGDYIGEMALFTHGGWRCATVRAATAVQVTMITVEHVESYLRHFPEAKHQLMELNWQRETDNITMEALVKLASAHEPLAAHYNIHC